MNLQSPLGGRVLCLHAAAKRLHIPERTLRYQASRGRIEGAFKQGKLWKFYFPHGDPRIWMSLADARGSDRSRDR